jgi:hypothetical protein
MRFKKELSAIVLFCVFLILGVGPRLNAVQAMECTAEAFQALGLISDESISVPHPVTNLSATHVYSYYPNYTEYCDVKGTIWSGIAFEIILPTTWNQRLYMAGNSGGQTQIYTQNLVQAAAKGYAAISSLGTGDANKEYDQWLIDWAYRTVHETAVIAKKIVKAYYSIDPQYSYFVGCSMGGRQGLMEAQRYPEDFDGILAGSAVNKQMTVLMESPAYLQPQLPTGSQIPPEKLSLLGKAVYDKCDGIDGLVDGIIDDPRSCTFDPGVDLPKCPGDVDGPACFTIAQLTAISKIYEGAYSNGTLIVPGMPKGAENFTGGWDPWIVAPTLKDTTLYKLHVNTFKRLMTGTTVTTYDFLTNWNFDSNDPATLAANGGIVESVNPDLTAFKAHGGKIIMYHGWADISNPFATSIAYYNSVYDLMGGQIKDVLSFYMVPGMGHCQGRYSRFDNGSVIPFIILDVFTPWFQPLVDWVEIGIAPESVTGDFRMVADNGTVKSFSRPICRYPEVARYSGTGDVNDAANFMCVPPIDFYGFFSPVDNPTVVNNAKAGQTIPVIWRITGANGVPVSDPTSFKNLTSYYITCDSLSRDTISTVEEYSAGNSRLQYLGDGYWQFNWKTLKTYTGQCRKMVLTLVDGSSHEAYFKFK